MEREQNSVDFKEESTLEQAPESLGETLRSVLPIFVAFWGFRSAELNSKRNKIWEAGKAVGGCKFARECFKIRCFRALDNRGPIVCYKPHSLWRLPALTPERPDRYK